jgi:alkylation response protein AidB-like acyl-CoA dehydrogenase
VDFALDDAQRAIAALAADVLARNGSAHHDHGEFSSDGAENSPRSWRDSWCNLASAGLLQLALPNCLGGDGLGVLGQVLAEVVGRHGDPADADTADLLRWLDTQVKRNLVLTFGGGVNEIQRELIATAGLGLPRVPR